MFSLGYFPAGETVAAFMSGMGHAGSAGPVTSSPSHGGSKGTIILQDSPQLTTKVTQKYKCFIVYA